jgi:predicted metal-dependent TIM-barrel fold hydrolase
VVAIGPIGLAGGTEREELVFSRQVDLARELRLPVLVYTPDHDKTKITRRVLDLLRRAEVDPRRVLIDRADALTVRLIREVGYSAVLSLGAGQHAERSLQARRESSRVPNAPRDRRRSRRDAVDEAASLVRSLGSRGIVLASGAGDGLGDLLALPRAADRLGRLGLSDAVIRRVCGLNALEVLGLDPSAVRAWASAPSGPSSHRTSR